MINKQPLTSFDRFAAVHDKMTGNTGEYKHQYTIDPALFEATGNIKGKIVYDIGCGNGYIARKMAKMGTKEVWASDISPKLISFPALKRRGFPKVKLSTALPLTYGEA